MAGVPIPGSAAYSLCDLRAVTQLFLFLLSLLWNRHIAHLLDDLWNSLFLVLQNTPADVNEKGMNNCKDTEINERQSYRLSFPSSYPRTDLPCHPHCLACDVQLGDTDCPAVTAAARNRSTTFQFLSGDWAAQDWRLLLPHESPSSELASMFQTLKNKRMITETSTQSSSSFILRSSRTHFSTLL